MTEAPRDYFHLDGGKPRVDLLPFRALLAVADVLEYGRAKYGERNWEHHADAWKWGQLLGSTLRHLMRWTLREDIDPESGRHHLAHAACDALMLLELVLCGRGLDDRTVLSPKE